MTKIREVVSFLETLAPPSLQESYDNATLITGDKNLECTGVLTCLDCLESVVDEAVAENCNMIVAHHPIVFSGLKSITGKNYIERTIIKAIKNDIAIYAIHTNLDNVSHGVNKILADALNLTEQKILSPKKSLLSKIRVFVPKNNVEEIRTTLFQAGAGEIGNYSECSYKLEGKGTFKANEGSNPTIGEVGEREEVSESLLEVIIESYKVRNAIHKMISAHPYEEPAYDVLKLENVHNEIGAGMIGKLEESMDATDFLLSVKKKLNLSVIKHTKLLDKKISTVAVCGGSGSFLTEVAKAKNADIFISADYKYHQFFDADNQIIIADIGHYESEQLTIQYLHDKITENFTTFAVLLTKQNTNPINYL